MIALFDDLVKLGGICTSRGEERRDNQSDGVESWHVVCLKYLQGGWVSITNVVCVHASRNEAGR